MWNIPFLIAGYRDMFLVLVYCATLLWTPSPAVSSWIVIILVPPGSLRPTLSPSVGPQALPGTSVKAPSWLLPSSAPPWCLLYRLLQIPVCHQLLVNLQYLHSPSTVGLLGRVFGKRGVMSGIKFSCHFILVLPFSFSVVFFFVPV